MKSVTTATVFWLLFAAVAVVQLFYAPTYPLKMDQSQVLYLAREYWHTGALPEHGIVNSMRAFNPPFMVWLYLAGVRLADIGLVLVLPGLAVHLAGLVLLYRLAARHLGAGVGLFASVLYGFLPCGLYFGHTSWAQGLLPGFYMMLVYAMASWALERQEWPLAVLPPLASWITGLHWGGILTVGVIAAIGWRFRAPIRVRPLLLGCLLAMTLWVPFLKFEAGRDFADIKVLWKGPLPIVAAETISPVCRELSGSSGEAVHLDEPVVAEDDIPVAGAGLKRKLSELSPGLFFGLRRAYWRVWRFGLWAGAKTVAFVKGMTYGLGANFVVPALSPAPGTAAQWTLFLAGTSLFLVGLGLVCRRLFLQPVQTTGAERFVVMAFVVPAVLQNLSGYSSADRPDVAWMLFGPQVILARVALSAIWNRGHLVRLSMPVVVAAMVALSAREVWAEYKYTVEWARGGEHPQRRMVAWIANDVKRRGFTTTAIRYDMLPERRTWFWIVSFSRIMDTYRISAEHDFLLFHRHGVRDRSRAPDGWAADPEYIVLLPEGLKRYDLRGGAYIHHDFGRYHVLKLLAR